MSFQRIPEGIRQNRYAIFFAFAIANGNATLLKVNVLDAQADAFEHTQAAAI
jgi:hypothetical protein